MCDQCEALMINGIYCHETGCPKAPRKCASCGQEFQPEFVVQQFCSDNCIDGYYLG